MSCPQIRCLFRRPNRMVEDFFESRETRLGMRMTRYGLLTIAALMVVVTGCGGGNRLELVPVKGVVTLDGKPLADARIIFRPAEGGRPSNAVTDSYGSYKLKYTEDQYGALPGKHSVSISTFVEADPDSSDPLIKTGRRESLPANYNTQTTLQAELESGSSEKLDFELKASGS